MRPTTLNGIFRRRWAGAYALLLVIGSWAQAATVNKASTGTDLTAGASWSGGAVPGASDVATWNLATSLGGTLTIGATANSTTSWQGVDVQAASADLVINGGAAGQTLSLGSSGLNLASGGKNLTFGSSQNPIVKINANQNWTIGSGRRVFLNSINLSVDSSVTAGGWAVVNNNSGTAASSGFNLGASGGTFDLTKAVISGAGSIFVNGGSGSTTIKLGEDNSYTGTMEVRNATKIIQFAKLAAGGVNSSFGAGIGILFIDGTGSTAATLENTGVGGVTARPLSTHSAAVGLSLLNNGSGDIAFNDSSTAIAMSAGTVTLGGANGSNTLAQPVSGPGGSGVSLAKSGNSTWKISGTQTYTGGTTIAGGTLSIVGGTLDNSAISFTGAGIIAIQPASATTINLGNTATSSAGASLNLGTNAFDMRDGAISTCNLQQGAAYAGAALSISSGAVLKFNLGNSSADLLAVTKSASVSGTVNVTLNTALMTSAVTPGTYNLLTASSGLSSGGATWQFTGGGTTQAINLGGTPYQLKLNASDTAVSVTVANLYTLAYNGNGNDSGTAPTDATSPYASGSTVTVLGPGTLAKSGSTFNGWNTAANGSGTSYNPSATFGISSNTTLYAQWSAASATISAPASFSAALTTTYGTASSATSVAVSGSGLTGDITATAPAGFEVSNDGSAFGTSAIFAPTGGLVSGTLYIRIKNTSSVAGNYNSQSVLLSSAGASSVTVATTVGGNVVNPKPLNVVSGTAQDKLRDGTTAAIVTGELDTAEAIGSGTSADGKPYTGDTLTLACTGSTFATAAAGSGIPVTAGTFTLGGAAAGNYTLNPPSLTLTAAILDTAVWASSATSAVWASAGNWLHGMVATNADNKADFSQVNITADTTVDLVTSLTIGGLIFGDTDASSAAGWTIGNGGNPANVLTLAGAAPVVNVSTLGAGKNVTISNVVAGSDGLTKQGAGTLVLSAINTYSGATTVANGTLALAGAAQLGAGSYAGAITNNGAIQITSSASNVFAGVIAGTGSLALGGGGAVTLNGTNSFAGGVTYSGAGVLTANVTGSLGTGMLTLNTGATRLSVAGGVVLSNPITINAANPGSGNAAINGADAGTIVLSGPVTITGGTSHFGNPNGGTVVVSGAITSSVAVHLRRGTMVLSGGGSCNDVRLNQDTLKLGADNGISQQAVLYVTSISNRNGTVYLEGFNQELAGLQGPAIGSTAAVLNTNGSRSTLALNTPVSSTYGGSITGNVSLVKSGTATQAFTGVLNYSGDTTINGGALVLGTGGTLTNTPVITVAGGSTFDVSTVSFVLGASQTLRGNGNVVGAPLITGTIAPGDSGIGTLTFSASPTLGGVARMDIDRNAGAPRADKIVGGAVLGGTLVVTNIGSQPQVGDVFDLFDGPVTGLFASLNLPPGGLVHWRTNNLVTDGTIYFTNNLPIARNVTTSVAQGGVKSIPFNLGKYSLATDADADGLTIVSVGASGHGMAGTDGTTITYTNISGTPGLMDNFSFTVSDGFGGGATGVVSVLIESPAGANLVSATASDGSAYMAYAGIPGTNYVLQWATNASKATWSSVQTNRADGLGRLYFTNTLSLYPTNDYFRTHLLP